MPQRKYEIQFLLNTKPIMFLVFKNKNTVRQKLVSHMHPQVISAPHEKEKKTVFSNGTNHTNILSKPQVIFFIKSNHFSIKYPNTCILKTDIKEFMYTSFHS